MLQQDYIMRLIREFFAALERALEKKEIESRSEAIHLMYEQYLGHPYEFFQGSSMEEVMEAINQYPEEQRIHRMEMLAELYYVEADMRATPFRAELHRRALLLFHFIDSHSGLFSFDRRNKIEKIEKELSVKGEQLNKL